MLLPEMGSFPKRITSRITVAKSFEQEKKKVRRVSGGNAARRVRKLDLYGIKP